MHLCAFINWQSYCPVPSMLPAWLWLMLVSQWSVWFVLCLVLWVKMETSNWILLWNKKRYIAKRCHLHPNKKGVSNWNKAAGRFHKVGGALFSQDGSSLVGNSVGVGYSLLHRVQGAGPEKCVENLHVLRPCSLVHYFVAPRSDFLPSIWHKCLKYM